MFEKAGLVFVFNWHGERSHEHFKVPVQCKDGHFRLQFDSDRPEFGGHTRLGDQAYKHKYEVSQQDD